MTPQRINLWERKLLDLTLANALINTRYGESCLQLQNTAAEEFYNAFLSCQQMALVPADEKHQGLQSVLEVDTMCKVAKSIMRTAYSNLSESGSEQLFLAFGMLHWRENPDPFHPMTEQKMHQAPAVLVPVHISRQRITGVYYIHPTGEEPMVNITLIELLKQQHERDLSKLIPQNGGAIQFAKVMADFRKVADSKECWSFDEAVCVGLFSFSKFVMWNDIHTNAEKMREAYVVESLVQKRMMYSDSIPNSDVRQLDVESKPFDMALPLDADSSQIEAIADVALGKSFLLYGPPGTGKSQTITNIIANSLNHDRQVLFVAQKRAALEVVQERLSHIGIAPFCLELHSNKITKAHLINQLSTVLDMPLGIPGEIGLEEYSSELYELRKRLLNNVEAVHKKRKQRAGTYSLADCIEQCFNLNTHGDSLVLSKDTLLNTTDVEADTVIRTLHEMDTIRSTFGEIDKHPLCGLYPRYGMREPLDIVHRVLSDMRKLLVDISLNQSGLRKLFVLPRLRKQYHLLELELNDMSISVIPSLATYEEKQQQISRWLSNWAQLSTWSQWGIRFCQLSNLGYEELATEVSTEDGNELANMFLYELYHARAMEIIESHEELAMFNGKVFDEVVLEYRKQAEHYQSLTAQFLLMYLQHNVKLTLASPNPQTQASLTQIRRWIKNHGRGMSIRDLFTYHGATIRSLCPCMLMSPISVAQYLPIDNDPFHVVLFDEASQIPTSEAVGSIARGKAIVIVGDPKQMPPTTFFQTQLNAEDDAADNDMESILDDCITLGMNEHYLNCHYRSRHESLIAFSNHYYYGDRLITFPSVDDRESRIIYNYVPGVYDYSKSRTNRIEAEAIVDEVIKRLQDTDLCRYSMGVIAFSKVQQDLIEDLLQERIGRNHVLEQRAWGDDVAEPLFIKNLENVQGDERDVILFSVCYGPQEDGKISMNFGPLNNTGGERRLNVAVTRARREMHVFSSMHSGDIDLDKSEAVGVAGLKNFLYYAENGVLPDEPDAERNADTVIRESMAQHLATALRKEGYQCDLAVGRSDFRIDVAVLDNRRPGKYQLGILFDGKSYYRSPMMRDREIIQAKVLNGLGWSLLRVWQTDYFRHPDESLKQILKQLKEL